MLNTVASLFASADGWRDVNDDAVALHFARGADGGGTLEARRRMRILNLRRLSFRLHRFLRPLHSASLHPHDRFRTEHVAAQASLSMPQPV